ncbi:hypothetical protein D3C72_1223480 [compost metagenome]
MAAGPVAGCVRHGQFDPVHGDEYRDAQGPERRRRQQRQQHAVDGADAVDEPGGDVGGGVAGDVPASVWRGHGGGVAGVSCHLCVHGADYLCVGVDFHAVGEAGGGAGIAGEAWGEGGVRAARGARAVSRSWEAFLQVSGSL